MFKLLTIMLIVFGVSAFGEGKPAIKLEKPDVNDTQRLPMAVKKKKNKKANLKEMADQMEERLLGESEESQPSKKALPDSE